ncbi:MAG: HAD hydrolase-like protein, partial [Pseudonocardiales bacterium]|nr:HAD hydrolase-like protein [Pseudonocardiales bacterium]
VTTEAAAAVAVVQGHSPDTGWRVLAEATVALRAGALWVACNLDPTLPTERGPLPGNGSMVAALRMASGLEPQVAGKPAPALVDASVRRTGAQRPLMIGDRLDTDIEGGRLAGMPTLLVLTGVSDAAELLAAPPPRRPDFVGADLGALTRGLDELAPGSRPGWTVHGGAGQWTLTSDGGDDPLDALLAVCGSHWADGGGPATVRGGDGRSASVLDTLGLSEVSATVNP